MSTDVDAWDYIHAPETLEDWADLLPRSNGALFVDTNRLADLVTYAEKAKAFCLAVSVVRPEFQMHLPQWGVLE